MSTVTFETLSQKRTTYLGLYLGGALLLLLAVGLWWAKVSVNPERVFWTTVKNSMSSEGVTLTVASDSDGTKDEQVIQYSMGNENKLHEIRTTTQGKNVVKTEWIGTSSKTYTRYTDIQSEESKGKTKDIIGVWADSSSAQSGVQLLPQVALGFALPLGAVPMPMGSISNQARDKIVHDMKSRSLYQVSYDKVKKETKDGKLYYTYDVSMQPALYLTIMKNFATAAGSKALDNVEPSQYANSEMVSLKLTVDAHAKQLVKVVNESQNYSETYSGHGVAVTVDEPQKVISLTELQKRLSVLQSK